MKLYHFVRILSDFVTSQRSSFHAIMAGNIMRSVQKERF